jgi:hypothetical protein
LSGAQPPRIPAVVGPNDSAVRRSRFRRAFCVWASHYKPWANYFFAPTRAWDGAWVATEPPPHVHDIAVGIEQAVNRIGAHAHSICVVLAVPTLKYAVSHALLVARRRHIPDDFLRLSRADALAQHWEMEHNLRAIAQRSGLKVVDPKDALCPADSCLYKADDQSLYFDDSHLSVYGTLYVACTLEPCFTLAGR